MALIEVFRMAWDSLISNKLRSFLTLLGMVIGVFAIIASVTAVNVIDVYFRDTIQFLGSTTFAIHRWPAVRFGPLDERIRNRKKITYQDMLLLRRRAELPVAVSASDDFAITRVRYDGRETDPNVLLIGSDQYYALNHGYEVAEGRFLSEDDVRFARPVVVMGATIAEKLFPNEYPIGKVVRIDGFRFRVIGVLARKGQAFGEDQDRRVIAPITRLLQLYAGRHDENITIEVRAPSVELLQATMDEVIGIMRVIRKVPPGKPNDFEIITNDSLVKTFTSFTRYLTLGGAGIGFIALLAAGIGIMNIMLVSVKERTREIGIRKAVGATRTDILKQFLLEAIFICEVGGLVGILLGVAGGNLFAIYAGIRPAFPWLWAMGGVFGVTLIAVVFGVYPAFQAAKLDPIEALRYE